MSLLQQLLEEGNEGFFVYGCLKWSRLAPDVRERVRGRLQSIHPMRQPFTAVTRGSVVSGVRRLLGISFKESPANGPLSQLFTCVLPGRSFELPKLQGPALQLQRVKTLMTLRVQLMSSPYRTLITFLPAVNHRLKSTASYGNSEIASTASVKLIGHHSAYPATQGVFMLRSFQYY